MTTEDFLALLRNVRRSGDGHVACCPAHEDKHQSLSVATGTDGRVLVRCHAGCETEDVVGAIGLTLADLMPEREQRREITATYDYHDAEGRLVFQVVRYVPKDFRQRKPDGHGGWDWTVTGAERVCYHLPQLLRAIKDKRRVFAVEGEKDVLTLEGMGFVATTVPGGANAWHERYTDTFAGAHVVIIPDNDEAGHKHAERIHKAITGVAASVVVLELPGLPERGDVTDWVVRGGTADELKALVSNPPPLSRPGLIDMKTVIGNLSRYKTEPMPPGVDYPWHMLTRATRGMRPGWFCIWAGWPGSGKTAAVLEICFAAGKRNQVVLFNSLEMNEEELGIRMVQRWGLKTDNLFGNRMTDDDRLAFDLAYNLPGYENVHICKEWTLADLERRVAEVKPDLVAVDYIGIMEPDSRDSDYQRTTRVSRGLLKLAESHMVPVLAVSHLSRPPDKGKVHVPTMHDLRSSGQLEGDADHIVIVFRDESGDDETGRCQSSEGRFIVAKNRHAPSSRPIPFKFDGESMTFSVIDPALRRAHEQGWLVHEGGGR